MQIIYQASDIIEAHIVSGMLAAAGIESHVDGYYLQGAIGSLPAQGFTNVTVDDRDTEAALAVIREYERK